MTESGEREEQDGTSSTPNETTQLISKSDHAEPPNITGLAMMRTIDFWLLFWIMSFCEYLCYGVRIID